MTTYSKPVSWDDVLGAVLALFPHDGDLASNVFIWLKATPDYRTKVPAVYFFEDEAVTREVLLRGMEKFDNAEQSSSSTHTSPATATDRLLELLIKVTREKEALRKEFRSLEAFNTTLRSKARDWVATMKDHISNVEEMIGDSDGQAELRIGSKDWQQSCWLAVEDPLMVLELAKAHPCVALGVVIYLAREGLMLAVMKAPDNNWIYAFYVLTSVLWGFASFWDLHHRLHTRRKEAVDTYRHKMKLPNRGAYARAAIVAPPTATVAQGPPAVARTSVSAAPGHPNGPGLI